MIAKGAINTESAERRIKHILGINVGRYFIAVFSYDEAPTLEDYKCRIKRDGNMQFMDDLDWDYIEALVRTSYHDGEIGEKIEAHIDAQLEVQMNQDFDLIADIYGGFYEEPEEE